MYIKRHSKGTLVSERIYTDFFQEITGETYNSCYLIALDYDTTLAHILRPFDVSQWYHLIPKDLMVSCQLIHEHDNKKEIVPYFFMRHEAVSPKDLYDKITDNTPGYCFFNNVQEGLNECKRSPRIQEAIRLNKLIEPNYESLYVIRPIVNISYEYRILIVDAKVHTIIPQALEDIYEESSVYFMFKDKVHTLAKKITTYLPYDNYCMDIVIVDGQPLLLELNPLLHSVTDLYPMEEFIDLRII